MPQPTIAEPVPETNNLALYQTKSGLEIHLQGSTHAVRVGKPKSVDAGKRFMANAKRYIGRLRRFLNHPQ